jgi:hypothetical protein
MRSTLAPSTCILFALLAACGGAPLEATGSDRAASTPPPYDPSSGTLPGPFFPGWINLGGPIQGGPGACELAPGVVMIVGRGLDGQVYSRLLSNGHWSQWTPTAGYGSSDPTCVEVSSVAADLYVRGNDGYLYSARWGLFTGIGPWKNLGTKIAGPIGATSWDNGGGYDAGTYSYALPGNDGNIYTGSYNTSTGFSGGPKLTTLIQPQGEPTIWRNVNASLLGNAHLGVAYQGIDHYLYDYNGKMPGLGQAASAPSVFYQSRHWLTFYSWLKPTHDVAWAIQPDWAGCGWSGSFGGNVASRPALINYFPVSPDNSYNDSWGTMMVFVTGQDGNVYYAAQNYAWYQPGQVGSCSSGPAPTINSFAISPSTDGGQSAYLNVGDSVTLSFAITPPSGCGSFSVGITGVDPGSNAVVFSDSFVGKTQGSVTMIPHTTLTNFSLQAYCLSYTAQSNPVTVSAQLYSAPAWGSCSEQCYKVLNPVNCFTEMDCNDLATEEAENPNADVTAISCNDFVDACSM